MSVKELDTKVAILEAEISQMTSIFSKLDVSIDKITDVSNCINKMLAVHEQKIAATQEDTEDLFHLVEKRRIELDSDMKELHSRITTGHREAQKEANALVGGVMDAISELKNHINAKDLKADESRWEMQRQITRLENRQWLILGGASVLGFMFGNLDLLKTLIS